MTTTSEPLRLREPQERDQQRRTRSGSHDRGAGGTYGRPRRNRERRRLVATTAIIAIPLGVMTAIGATVIKGYHEHTQAPVAAENTAASAPADVAPTGADAELLDHAPTGNDVGTEGLDAQLTRAITRARDAAAKDGVTINIVSGYRTAATQQQLYDAAIKKYGSAAEARKWVLPPQDSAHVEGKAVDVGPYAAASWLQKNGVQFGLCRRYANEYWHFEVLAPAKGQKCPALEANAAVNATG